MYKMQFASDSGKLVKIFLPFIKAQSAYKTQLENLNFKTNLDNMLLLLYRDIANGEAYVSGQIQKNCFKTHIRGKHELIKPSIIIKFFYSR